MRSSTRRTRAEQTEDNRVALLATAEELFGERGYTATTLDGIAERAGFSKGVVYSRFASKADVFLAVLERRIEVRARQNAEHLRVAVASDDPVGTIVRRVRADPDVTSWRLALLEFQLVAAREPELQRRYADLHRRTLEGVATIAERLVARLDAELGVEPIKLARAIFALDNGLAIEMLVTPDALSLDDQADFLRRLLTGAGHSALQSASETARFHKDGSTR